MRPNGSALISALIFVLNASGALAACDFDSGPAKGIRTSMVRAFSACPGTEHPAGNSETEGGTVSCAPVKVRQHEGTGFSTPYNFSDKGYCTVQTRARIVNDCAELEDEGGMPLGLPQGPCHVTFVKSKCSGILGTTSVANDDSAGLIGAPDDGWTVAALTRATLNDDASGDMTVIDFPVSFRYSTPDKGKMQINSTSAQALIPLVGVNGASLPTCTSIELVDMTVKDPQGLPFARPGAATRP